MAYRQGKDCTLSVAGVEIIRATDVNKPKSSNEINTTTRNEGVWEGNDVGHNRWGVDFTMKFYIGDTAVTTLNAAWKAQTEVAVAFTGGAGGTESGVGKITGFNESEPLDDVVTVAISVIGNGALA